MSEIWGFAADPLEIWFPKTAVSFGFETSMVSDLSENYSLRRSMSSKSVLNLQVKCIVEISCVGTRHSYISIYIYMYTYNYAVWKTVQLGKIENAGFYGEFCGPVCLCNSFRMDLRHVYERRSDGSCSIDADADCKLDRSRCDRRECVPWHARHCLPTLGPVQSLQVKTKC